MNNKASTFVIIVIIVIIILISILLITGYLGMLEAKANNANCELGIKNILCYKWSKIVLLD
jgi:hypothetical protein